MEPLQVESLLKAENTTAHFSSLVRRYARAAISGMVPKFIAPEENGGESVQVIGKPTLHTSRYIIKGSDDSTPYLGFNEFHTMRVLERLNVMPVARTRMSEDGRVLVVDRFDVDAQGVVTHGVEDACGLLGLPPHEKYATTMARLCESAVDVGREVIEAARNEPRWHVVAKQMVHAWNDGMASLRSPKASIGFRGLDEAIALAGFSEPERPESGREVLGRSELLGKPRKR